MAADTLDSRRFFAAGSLASAILTLLLVATAAPPPEDTAELLSYFRAHRASFALLATTVLCWMVVSLVAMVALERMVAGGRPALAFAGLLLSAGGILLLGFGTFMFVGALFSIDGARAAAGDAAQANFHALVWRNLSFMLSDPGLMALGAGQAITGGLAWAGRGLPRWVAAIGVLGGIAGLLTLAVFQTPALALVQLAAFCVTGAATAFILFKAPRAA